MARANRQRGLLHGYPLSFAELDKVKADGVLRRYLEMYASGDMCREFDDFLQDTMDGTKWNVANSGGTSAASFAWSVAAEGKLQGDTGTSDNGSISLDGNVLWMGDRNAGMEIRIKVDDPTAYNLEIGLVNANPGSNNSAVSDVDTPAVTMTDGAVFQIDTDQTLQTLAFVTEGSTADQNVVATTLPTGFTNLTAATYHRFKIQLVGNDAYAWMDGALVARHDAVAAGALEGGTRLCPFVYCRTRNTTAKFPEIDYIHLWQDRV